MLQLYKFPKLLGSVKLRLDQSKIVSDFFLIRISNSALSVLIGLGF